MAPPGTGRSRRLGERGRSPFIEFGVLGVDDDHGRIDLRMRGQNAE